MLKPRSGLKPARHRVKHGRKMNIRRKPTTVAHLISEQEVRKGIQQGVLYEHLFGKLGKREYRERRLEDLGWYQSSILYTFSVVMLFVILTDVQVGCSALSAISDTHEWSEIHVQASKWRFLRFTIQSLSEKSNYTCSGHIPSESDHPKPESPWSLSTETCFWWSGTRNRKVSRIVVVL